MEAPSQFQSEALSESKPRMCLRDACLDIANRTLSLAIWVLATRVALLMFEKQFSFAADLPMWAMILGGVAVVFALAAYTLGPGVDRSNRSTTSVLIASFVVSLISGAWMLLVMSQQLPVK